MLMLIRGGRVIDPGNHDGVMDILVENGKIVEIKEHFAGPGATGPGSGGLVTSRGEVAGDRIID